MVREVVIGVVRGAEIGVVRGVMREWERCGERCGERPSPVRQDGEGDDHEVRSSDLLRLHQIGEQCDRLRARAAA